jgi:hypothetical protein
VLAARDAAAVIAALLGVLAAVSSQLGYWQGRLADPATYFGGYAVTPDHSERGVRAEGQRERSKLLANLCESSTTSLVVGTALVGLYAGFANYITLGIATLGLSLGFGVPLIAVCKWFPQRQRIIARTEYYVMNNQGLKMLPVDEQRRRFAEKHPRLARWL